MPAARPPVPVPAPTLASAEPTRPAATATAAAPAASRPAVPVASSEAPVPALRELPEALRRELPPLSASGAMYSDTAANSLLIINGQLYHEGDPVAPGLVLEQIKLRSAVLSWRGQRFRLDY
jgi:general secretion pathway protein B